MYCQLSVTVHGLLVKNVGLMYMLRSINNIIADSTALDHCRKFLMYLTPRRRFKSNAR